MLGPAQSGPWRVAYPVALGCGLAASAGLAAVWPPLGVVALGWWLAQLLAPWAWRAVARRQGFHARWVIPGPAGWWRRRLAPLGLVVPPGPVWEMHAVDSGRWAGSPPMAARAFRAAYTADMQRLVATVPPGVTVVCSTFNRLTPEERDWITAQGGTLTVGAVHPRLASVMTPRAYQALQRALFGGVVSRTRRDDPACWTTWLIPARP